MPQLDTPTTTPRTALVTGASAGIGAAFARKLAAEGYNLILVARREDRLRQLCEELAGQYPNRYEKIVADLSDPSAPGQVFTTCHELGMPVDFLVNNAGFGGDEMFSDTPWPAIASEIQVMITAATELSHLMLPGMKARGWGRIINVSSIAAFMPPTTGLLYTGIKSYLLHFSQSLDLELKPYGIRVCAVCPGFTKTEFHEGMDKVDALNTTLPDAAWQDSDQVALEGYDAAMAGRPVVVTGMVNRIITALVGRLPLSWRYLMGGKITAF
jgi:short-subunit dehydrogenase